MSRNIIIWILCAVGKASSFIFSSVGIERWQKINVLYCALAFLVQMFNFSTFFCIMHNGSGYRKLRELGRDFVGLVIFI
ncbi:hypothetical protein, partial [Christiangramia forsetii]